MRKATAVFPVDARVRALPAIDPAWPVWQKVALGAAVGLAADAAPHRLARED